MKIIEILGIYFSTLGKLQLTSAELRILFHLYKGKTAKEIAEITCNSVHTIRKHISNLHSKFDVRNNIELINKTSEEI